MTDLEFQTLADDALKQVELACDRTTETTDDDIDARRVGSMLTLVLPNRTEVVVNLQKPLHELWLASKLGGYHYRHVEGRWENTKLATAPDFFAQLQQDVQAQAQVNLDFS